MVTHIDREFTADTFFPAIDPGEWYLSEKEEYMAEDPEALSFTYATYLRLK